MRTRLSREERFAWSMLITPPVVAWVTGRYGWRASFVVTGTLGFLLIPPWLLLHHRIRLAYGTPDLDPAARLEARERCCAHWEPRPALCRAILSH